MSRFREIQVISTVIRHSYDTRFNAIQAILCDSMQFDAVDGIRVFAFYAVTQFDASHAIRSNSLRVGSNCVTSVELRDWRRMGFIHHFQWYSIFLGNGDVRVRLGLLHPTMSFASTQNACDEYTVQPLFGSFRLF
jgi:hypothetical protein